MLRTKIEHWDERDRGKEKNSFINKASARDSCQSPSFPCLFCVPSCPPPRRLGKSRAQDFGTAAPFETPETFRLHGGVVQHGLISHWTHYLFPPGTIEHRPSCTSFAHVDTSCCFTSKRGGVCACPWLDAHVPSPAPSITFSAVSFAKYFALYCDMPLLGMSFCRERTICDSR